MPLLDTWTWIAYFAGGREAEPLIPIVEGPEVATSILTFGELSDQHARHGVAGLAERLAFIAGRGPVLEVPAGAARRAGPTKWRQRRAGHDMGLVDAMIYETAREHSLGVVTGDVGFKGLPGVTMIPGGRKTP